MQDLIQQRKELAKVAYNTYNPDAFPGSKAWRINNEAEVNLRNFDLSHPEVKAEINKGRCVIWPSDCSGQANINRCGNV